MVNISNGGGFPGAVALWESDIAVPLADQGLVVSSVTITDTHNNYPLDVLAMDANVSAVPEPATFALAGWVCWRCWVRDAASLVIRTTG